MVKKVVKTTVTETVKEVGSKKKKTTKRSTKKSKAKPKKRAKKRRTTKKTVTTVVKPSMELLSLTKRSFENLEKRDHLLIENFVGLQEAMTNLSTKFSELSQNLNNLLGVFELAAKTLAESEKQVDNTLSTKLDALIEQNKSISREINMVDGKMRRKSLSTAPQSKPSQPLYAGQIQTPQPTPAPKPAGQPSIPPKQLPKV